ncbi:MAG: lipopolysaccharide biosynthesis protein [Sandaracinaceae bacterium]
MAEETQNEETRRAGRGFLWVAGGKIVFIITAYAVALALPRLFGSPEVFGLYAVAFGAASILNNVLIASTVQSVSKLVSEDEERAPRTLRQGLRIQLVIGSTLGGLLVLGAPLVAEGVLLDPALTPLIRIAGAVVFTYALYAALVGFLNGQRKFSHQARLDMTFSVLRTTGLLGGAALGIGAIGAIGGFAMAASVILLVALVVVGIGKPGEGVPLSRWWGFMAPIWLYQAALNGILQIDLQVLKRTATELALSAGHAAADASRIADGLAGTYRAAQTFAFVPYQLILAVTFIVFPFVSKATSLGDEEATRGYIRNAMRFSLLVLLSIAAPIGGAASGVLRIAYPDAYLEGADALGVLVFGQVAFALFVIGATILSGGGRPGTAATIAIGALVVVLIATRIAITTAGIDGHGALVAAAAGTSLGTGLALLAVGVVVYSGFGAFIPPLSAVRGIAAGALAFGFSRFVPHDTAFTALGALVGGFFVFGFGLVITGELGKSDLARLRTILKR